MIPLQFTQSLDCNLLQYSSTMQYYHSTLLAAEFRKNPKHIESIAALSFSRNNLDRSVLEIHRVIENGEQVVTFIYVTSCACGVHCQKSDIVKGARGVKSCVNEQTEPHQQAGMGSSALCCTEHTILTIQHTR